MDLCELFNVPEAARDYLHFFISEEEQRVILEMGPREVTQEEMLCIIQANVRVSGFEVESYLYRLYHRGVISKKVVDEKLYYILADFWKRMTLLAQYESWRWKQIPEKLREMLDVAYVNRYGEDATERLEKVMRGELKTIENAYFLTLEETLKTIDKVNSQIYIIPCNCKRLALNCEETKPYDICTSFSRGLNSEWDRGYGTEISKEEAKEMVKGFRKAGLMQSSELEWGLCNCCGCCCYPIRASKESGTKGLWPLQRYRIHWHEELCIHCGACAKICNFGAFQKEGKRVSFDESKCWGCTICFERCPRQAIQLEKIVDDEAYGLEF